MKKKLDLAVVGIALSALGHAAFGAVLFVTAPSIERTHAETVAIEFRNVQEEASVEEEPDEPEPEPEPTPLPPVLRKTHRPEPEARLAEEAVFERPLLDPELPPDSEPPQAEVETPEVGPSTSDAPAFGVTMESVVEANPGLQAPVGGVRRGAVGGRRGPRKGGRAAPGTAGGGAPREHVRVLPILTKRVIPDYTRPARRAGVEGRVHLRIAVGSDGRVVSARVVRGLGHGLDEAALAAARRLRFRPGKVDGTPTRMEIPFSFAFTLDD